MKFNNNYFLLRHGEALSNKRDVVSCWVEKFHNPLTIKGKKQVKESAEKLKKEKIDYIFSSDVLRTKMSSEIAGKNIKVTPRFDKRLREYNVGIYNGVATQHYWKKYQGFKNRFRIKPEKGESYADARKRTEDFLKDINKKYKGKNILIVSHQLIIFFLLAELRNLSRQELLKKYILDKTSVPVGSLTISKIKNK